MGKDSAIEWTHHTFNPWWGCSPVSMGCEHCYARSKARWLGIPAEWVQGGVRTFQSESYWRQPLRWNAEARELGERRRVFCGSMCDVFEAHADPGVASARSALRTLIDQTLDLDWLLLTKRPEGIPKEWRESWPANAWIGITAEDQRWLELRWPHIADIPAPVRFVSNEPAFGALRYLPPDGLDWIIVGGESGPKARYLMLADVQVTLRVARERRVACMVKQLGGMPMYKTAYTRWGAFRRWPTATREGRNPAEWPEDLRVREYPTPKRRH